MGSSLLDNELLIRVELDTEEAITRVYRLHQNLHSLTMSDDEYETMSNTSMKGDEAFAKRKAGVQKNELNEQLKDYINQWREERAKEEAELKRMKDKQAARKEIRAEQEKKQAQAKREEEEKIKREENEKKAAEAELKKKQMEEAEIIKSFHLTLAYQFPQKHFSNLEELARDICVPSGPNNWELRLYSYDS